MNAVASLLIMEAPHQGNLVAPFLGCTDKGPGNEGELRGFEVSFWTSRDCFGPAEPSTPWHLGNQAGNHPMWQAVNLVETEGQAGNSVAVSATNSLHGCPVLSRSRSGLFFERITINTLEAYRRQGFRC